MKKVMAATVFAAAFCAGAQAEMPAPSLKSVAPALKAVPAVPAVPGVAGAAATTSLSGAAAASASMATPAASMPAEKADAKKKGGMMDSMKKVPVDKVIDKVM